MPKGVKLNECHVPNFYFSDSVFCNKDRFSSGLPTFSGNYITTIGVDFKIRTLDVRGQRYLICPDIRPKLFIFMT